MKTIKLKSYFLPIILILSIWFVLSYFNLVPKSILPSPLVVATKGLEMIGNGQLLYHTGITLFRGLVGFLLATTIGIPASLLTGINKTSRWISMPVIDFLRGIPRIAFIPLFILLFGMGNAAIFFIIAFSGIWILATNIHYGIKNIDPLLIMSAKSIGAKGHELIFKIVMPAIAPYIFSALKICISISLGVTIASEFLMKGGLDSGLGFLMMNALKFHETEILYIIILAVGIIGLVLNYLLGKTETKLGLVEV